MTQNTVRSSRNGRCCSNDRSSCHASNGFCRLESRGGAIIPPDTSVRKHQPSSSQPEVSTVVDPTRVLVTSRAPDANADESAMPKPKPKEANHTKRSESRDKADIGNPAEKPSSQNSKAAAVNGVSQVPGIREMLRGPNERDGYSTVLYSIEPGCESDIRKILDRSASEWNPWNMILLPGRQEPYGTTEELFNRIKKVIGEQTNLSDEVSALLTFWVFSTWFRGVLSLAPCLVITGWGHDGEAILSTLRSFSYHPLLMAGLTSANLNNLPGYLHTTLLIAEPYLSRRMALLLECSTSRGYQAILKGDRFDYFDPKAIYIGEDHPARSMPNSVHINASDTRRGKPRRVLNLSDEVAQHFQDQLFCYRAMNMQRVFKSDFSASGLPPEANAIANALGSCIVDAPDLRAKIASLLTPQARHQTAEHLDDLGTVAVGAALPLCHQGKDKILVGEIAAEVNRILRRRGERSQFSAEKVGHKLKKVGLLSRRLGGAGNGFLLDHSTQVLLHEVAAVYDCVGLSEEEENLHCTLCEQTKSLMEVM